MFSKNSDMEDVGLICNRMVMLNTVVYIFVNSTRNAVRKCEIALALFHTS